MDLRVRAFRERTRAKARAFRERTNTAQLQRHADEDRQQAARHAAERQPAQDRLDDALHRENALTAVRAMLTLQNEHLSGQTCEQNAAQEELREEHSIAVAEGRRLTAMHEDREVTRRRHEEANAALSRCSDALSQQIQQLVVANAARQREANVLSGQAADEEGVVRRLERQLRRYANGQHSHFCRNNPHGHSSHWCLQCPYGVIAYHRTTREGAISLERHGVDIDRYARHRNYAGKGLYCACSPEMTKHKVGHQSGRTDWVVKVGLRLGRVLELNHSDSQLSEALVKQRGFDSVVVTDRHGLEYVVYRNDQVQVIGVPFQSP